ncbi:hypothetical protein OS493_010662 [Desmophyllum pertusum]|uniref:Uncharacterized protein n=1 Tax=Desmophyllum pertusum TaxID=174260 RepID=A0A9W9ZSL1_9CNID|nr:hypothetical protein OS493_010662 [Desmophyllum pertusum]
MYKITETLKTFVSRKKIADFTVTRVFAAQNTENENDTIPRKQPQSSQCVVRVDQTYYGGVPRKRGGNLQMFHRLLRLSTAENEENEPTLSHDVSSEDKREDMRNFSACVTKDDFTSICLKATQEFIVAKEMITNSRTLKSSTSFTLRRKENLSATTEIAETMKDFYTSANLLEHSDNSPEFKPSTPLLEMEI